MEMCLPQQITIMSLTLVAAHQVSDDMFNQSTIVLLILYFIQF